MKTKSLLGRRVQFAFGSAIFIMLTVGAISYRGMRVSSESDRRVRHTHEVLERLQDLLFMNANMEADYRGFVLTGNEFYFESYNASILEAQEDEAILRDLTGDNPSQQRQFPRLQKLMGQKIEFGGMIIGLSRNSGLQAATDAIRAGKGHQIMNEFRGVVREMRDEELRLLAQRDADAKRRFGQAKSILILGTALGVLIAAAAGWSVQRDSFKREVAEEALQSSEENLRQAIEAAEMGTWFWDIQRDQISWSAKFRSIFGLTSDAKLTYKEIFQVIHPDDREQLDQRVKKSLELDLPYDTEHRVVWPDSSVHWIAAKGSVQRNSAGVAVQMRGIAMDITGLKDAQEARKHREALERRAVELKRSNDDLQQFAYIAAHDLQEPLRMVASYTQLLSRRYKGKLDSDADDFIAFAVDGAHRMQHLIGDLLAYCRVGTTGKELRETSSSAALDEALLNLHSAIQESGAVVTRDPLPTVMADTSQLVQLFQNLVGNAIKYRSAVSPLVHVSARKNGGNEWIFSMRDNGLGIDPQYFDKIFVMFQRLHGRKEFSGTGIGLTMCKKITERHGGRIWVESAPGKGSTFYFALPEKG